MELKMNSIQKSKLGAIIISSIAILGLIIGIVIQNKYLVFIAVAFFIGMLAYCFYLGREQEKRKEENWRRKFER